MVKVEEQLQPDVGHPHTVDKEVIQGFLVARAVLAEAIAAAWVQACDAGPYGQDIVQQPKIDVRFSCREARRP